MYICTATQHLLSQCPTLHRLPPSSSSLSNFSPKSFSISITSITSPSSSLRHFLAPFLLREASSSLLRAPLKSLLPPSRAAGYEEGEEDDVYVKSFKSGRQGDSNRDSTSKWKQASQSSFSSSSRMGERRKFDDESGGTLRDSSSSSRFSSDRSGFKGDRKEFNSSKPYSQDSFDRGDSGPRDRPTSREGPQDRFRDGDVQKRDSGNFRARAPGGERDNSSFRPRGRGEFEGGRRNGDQTESRGGERDNSSFRPRGRGEFEGGRRNGDQTESRGGERDNSSFRPRGRGEFEGGRRNGDQTESRVGERDNSSFRPRGRGEFEGGRRNGDQTESRVGERDNSSFRPRGRGEFEGGRRNGDQLQGRGRGLDGRGRGSETEDEVDGVNVNEVEYRNPKWTVDPKTERKRKKEPAVAPQVHFDNPMNKEPHVAILGGGMSGLVCALTLEQLGIRSTVFDTGKHGLGGRMATRNIQIREGFSLAFDHAAQYFTVSDPKFHKLVDKWVMEGAVKEWKGVLGTLQAGGEFSQLVDDVPRYVGVDGMGSLANHMVSQGRLIEVKRPVWISNMDAKGNQWSLNENGKPHGVYDAVVIAHNGKCANRLLAPSGAPEVFKQMKKLELSSIWALMAAFEEAIPIPEGVAGGHLDGAFVEGVSAVSWMANNSKKLNGTAKDAPHCWTFFSTAAYGKKNKVPQESIPIVKAERVRREMLQGAEIALGLPEGSMPSPFFTKVQLWGAGLPTNTPSVPCIFDPVARVGICGDWLLGSSLEGAALSGMALAEHIADFRDRGDLNVEEFSIGLHKGFSQVEGKDIGQFPGTLTSQPEKPRELVQSLN